MQPESRVFQNCNSISKQTVFLLNDKELYGNDIVEPRENLDFRPFTVLYILKVVTCVFRVLFVNYLPMVPRLETNRLKKREFERDKQPLGCAQNNQKCFILPLFTQNIGNKGTDIEHRVLKARPS